MLIVLLGEGELDNVPFEISSPWSRRACGLALTAGQDPAP